MRILMFLGILPAIFAVSACASSQRAAGNTGYLSRNVLTRDEVASGMGEGVAKVVQIPPDRCRYIGENPIDFITIRASRSGGQTEFRGATLAAGLMHLPRAQSAGVGDESYWTQRVLWVRKGDAFLAIDMGTAPVDQQAAGVKLARIAVSRL